MDKETVLQQREWLLTPLIASAAASLVRPFFPLPTFSFLEGHYLLLSPFLCCCAHSFFSSFGISFVCAVPRSRLEKVCSIRKEGSRLAGVSEHHSFMILLSQDNACLVSFSCYDFFSSSRLKKKRVG